MTTRKTAQIVPNISINENSLEENKDLDFRRCSLLISNIPQTTTKQATDNLLRFSVK